MAQNVEDIFTEVQGPISPAEIPDILARIHTDILLRAALSAGENVAVGGTEASTVAAMIGAAIEVLPFLILVGLLVFLLSFWHRILIDIIGPVPLVGRPTVKLINQFWPPTTPLTDWAARKYESLVGHLWNDLTNIVGYFATRYVLTHHHAPIPSNTPSTEPFTGTSAFIQHEIDNLNSKVNTLWSYVHNQTPTALPAGIVSLPEQLYKLQQDIQIVYHNQSSLLHDIQVAFSEIHTIGQHVEQLTHQLGSLRAVQVGWVEFEQQANQSLEQLRSVESHLAERIDTNSRSIAELSPLTLLLEPGIPGLRNLRKLEDKPCQCPQPRILKPPEIEALAMIEFIENG